jgi:hypothetical protein
MEKELETAISEAMKIADGYPRSFFKIEVGKDGFILTQELRLSHSEMATSRKEKWVSQRVSFQEFRSIPEAMQKLAEIRL